MQSSFSSVELKSDGPSGVLVWTKNGFGGARVDFEFAAGYLSGIWKPNLHQLATANHQTTSNQTIQRPIKMKVFIIFQIIALVASLPDFNKMQQRLNAYTEQMSKLTTAERLQHLIDSQKQHSPCKRYIYKGRSTANCGNKSNNVSQHLLNLTAEEKARIARNIDFLRKIRF